jgi:predicted GH43/DUF377 family glycosyl hydrolase
MKNHLDTFETTITRLGVALDPQGEYEEEGVLNPACALDRQGQLLLYTRAVARGNVSRVGIVRVSENQDGSLDTERLGFALEPQAEYERNGAVGEGCEDPRVTFVPILDCYLMLYTAYGARGPRVAVASSRDGYVWKRIGLIEFPAQFNLHPDDKDAAFFPEPVISPAGVLSIAFYHRPMVHIPPEVDKDEIQSVLNAAAAARQSIRIAYVPLADVFADIANITRPTESRLVMAPDGAWGHIKVGGGTAPVRIAEGWLSIYHGVDAMAKPTGGYAMRYSAGVVVHDARRPHRIRYASTQAPVLVPSTDEELQGTVNNVVFPTALVPRPDLGDRTFDCYYGMADFRIGRFRLQLGSAS